MLFSVSAKRIGKAGPETWQLILLRIGRRVPVARGMRGRIFFNRCVRFGTLSHPFPVRPLFPAVWEMLFFAISRTRVDNARVSRSGSVPAVGE